MTTTIRRVTITAAVALGTAILAFLICVLALNPFTEPTGHGHTMPGGMTCTR